MKGYECRAKCALCKGNLTHFLEDAPLSTDEVISYFTLWCIHCKKSYLVAKPTRNIDMWTGWSQDYIEHPKKWVENSNA